MGEKIKGNMVKAQRNRVFWIFTINKLVSMIKTETPLPRVPINIKN
jgi:hypothetical protein